VIPPVEFQATHAAMGWKSLLLRNGRSFNSDGNDPCGGGVLKHSTELIAVVLPLGHSDRVPEIASM